ncbi:imidazoleglycerol-phosphate dehydratase HisB [Candidatus Vidania fulgoroideorum]
MKKNFFYERFTNETEIKIRINTDSHYRLTKIQTGIPFFDHMLRQISFHGNFSIDLACKGDLNVDNHHLIEDVGISLGKIYKQMFEYRKYKRYVFFYLPMEESLTRMAVDICNRPFFKFNYSEIYKYTKCGFTMENVYEFFKSFANNSKISMHIENYGSDVHHRIESIFKCFGVLTKKIFKLEKITYINSTKDLK